METEPMPSHELGDGADDQMLNAARDHLDEIIPGAPPKNMSRQSSRNDADYLRITVEFTGGAELLVGNQKKHDVSLYKLKQKKWTVANLLPWIVDNLLTVDNPDLLMQDATVRPGMLVMVNDTDWELLGAGNYELRPGDHVTFISTLHGG